MPSKKVSSVTEEEGMNFLARNPVPGLRLSHLHFIPPSFLGSFALAGHPTIQPNHLLPRVSKGSFCACQGQIVFRKCSVLCWHNWDHQFFRG